MSTIEDTLQLFQSNEQVFIALDRDGTLVPYTDRPEDAVMSDSMRRIIGELVALPKVKVAIVSARGVTRLKDDLLDKQVILAGNYGMEILFPDGKMLIQPEAERTAPLMAKVRQKLTQLMQEITNSILEDDIYSLCLHWHMVPSEQREQIHNLLHDFKKDLDSGITMKTLPTSYEFMPDISWNKASALEAIINHLDLKPNNCLKVYIGDTERDEPAFLWANNYGGVSVRVGAAVHTNAKQMLAAPENVAHFLRQIKRQLGD